MSHSIYGIWINSQNIQNKFKIYLPDSHGYFQALVTQEITVKPSRSQSKHQQ